MLSPFAVEELEVEGWSSERLDSVGLVVEEGMTR